MQLEGLIKKEKRDWEKESLLGKFYQVGLTMDIQDVWLKAEANLSENSFSVSLEMFIHVKG